MRMRALIRICFLSAIIFTFHVVSNAQANPKGGGITPVTGLPKLVEGESYRKVRIKMIRAGWKPYHSPDADVCDKGDKRCQGRPEMSSCSGTGEANCAFLWKRKGKTVEIYTKGLNTGYSGFRLQ